MRKRHTQEAPLGRPAGQRFATLVGEYVEPAPVLTATFAARRGFRCVHETPWLRSGSGGLLGGSAGTSNPFGCSVQPQRRHPLARVAPDLHALGTTVQPVATLDLDCIEARFAGHFRRLMDEANAQRVQPEKAAAS